MSEDGLVSIRQAVTAGMLFLVIGFVWSVSRTSEPRYDGRRFTVWLREYQASGFHSTERRDVASRALQRIGTNAVPFLIERIRSIDPRWKTELSEIAYNRLRVELGFTMALERRQTALDGFSFLGLQAVSAIPALTELLSSSETEVAAAAVYALSSIGSEQCVGPLIQATASREPEMRRIAAWGLGNLRSRAVKAIPQLVKLLGDADPSAQQAAARALGDIGIFSPRALPALADALQSSDMPLKMAALAALASYGTNAQSLLPLIRMQMDTRDSQLQAAAARALVRVRCEMRDGAIVRGPILEKRIALVFAGNEHDDGGAQILHELTTRHLRASFFLSTSFLENYPGLAEQIAREDFFLGPHLQQAACTDTEPRKTLITQQQFQSDLRAASWKLSEMRAFTRGSEYLFPMRGLYNREVADWARSMRRSVICGTPGTLSASDNTPESNGFISSSEIIDSVLQRERQSGLNGFLLVFHLGSGPQRADKMHAQLGALLDTLIGRGYQFVRVDELVDTHSGAW